MANHHKDHDADYTPQQLQQKFERWRELYNDQLDAQLRWQEAEALYAELVAYYQSPQWMTDREEDKALEYSGTAHSILSEDGLWNMISDRNALAMQWMRLGLEAIEQREKGEEKKK